MNTKPDQNMGFLLSRLADKLARGKYTPHQQHNILLAADIALNIVSIVVLVLLLRTFIMSPFQVYGISMCNTLNYHGDKCIDSYGDYIIINKSSYLQLPGWKVGTPQRGDVIVFRSPQNHQEFFIKRVIALPGESIELIDGYVYLYNSEHPRGIKLAEPYLSAANQGNTVATGGISKFTVPAGHYFVLGDNRSKSSDSRLCFKESPGSPGCGEKGITPYLDSQLIEGKAALVLWPEPHIIQTHVYPELAPSGTQTLLDK